MVRLLARCHLNERLDISDEESPPRSRTAAASRTPASGVQRQNVNRKRRICDLQAEKATDKPNSKQQANADQVFRLLVEQK